jgi:hypothetical protein
MPFFCGLSVIVRCITRSAMVSALLGLLFAFAFSAEVLEVEVLACTW